MADVVVERQETENAIEAARAAQGSRPRYVRFTANVLRSVGIMTDALCILVAALLAKPIYDIFSDLYLDMQLHATGATVLALNFFLVRLSRDAYSSMGTRGDNVGRDAILDFLLAATLTAITAVQFGVFGEFSRGMLLIFVTISIVMFFFGRLAMRQLVRKLMVAGVIGQRVAIYGADAGNARRVIDLLTIERLAHVKIVGFADDRRTRIDAAPIDDVHFIGGFDDLLDLARCGLLDQVIIALPRAQQARIDQIADQLSAASIDVCIMPREVLELRTRYRMNYIGELPVLKVWQQPVRDLDGVLKELQDRVLAAIGILLLSPILIAAAIAIRLESKGPILFVQRRFGFNNLEIDVLKFRSMYHDRADLSGADRTLKDDPRVTKVGKFIRRTSIDELPQLFNVLRGEMSLVGPRPHPLAMKVGDRYYFDAVRNYGARHRVKPGITGLAQVRGLRGEINTIDRAKRRVEYDVYYIEHWSPLLDIRIILETVVQLLWPRNVY
ncbi:MAG: undecaprenyl-phosphate glucose phosphotransferase [Sphingomonadaceae bacterium]